MWESCSRPIPCICGIPATSQSLVSVGDLQHAYPCVCGSSAAGQSLVSVGLLQQVNLCICGRPAAGQSLYLWELCSSERTLRLISTPLPVWETCSMLILVCVGVLQQVNPLFLWDSCSKSIFVSVGDLQQANPSICGSSAAVKGPCGSFPLMVIKIVTEDAL